MKKSFAKVLLKPFCQKLFPFILCIILILIKKHLSLRSLLGGLAQLVERPERNREGHRAEF
jgi:hypothetical protein